MTKNAPAMPTAIRQPSAPATIECRPRPRIPAATSQIAAATNPIANRMSGTRIQDRVVPIDIPEPPAEPISIPGMLMPGMLAMDVDRVVEGGVGNADIATAMPMAIQTIDAIITA